MTELSKNATGNTDEEANKLIFISNDEWERNTMKTVMDTVSSYLPYSESGAIDIKYKKVIKRKAEGKIVYYDNLTDGLSINIVLEFNEPMDISDTDLKG
jgi:hypothetical protein